MESTKSDTSSTQEVIDEIKTTLKTTASRFKNEEDRERMEFVLEELDEIYRNSKYVDANNEKIKSFVYEKPTTFETATRDFVKLLWSDVPLF
jgi:hypothetical protein